MGLPKTIISDNSKELRANLFQDWDKQHNIDWQFIQPSKPMQNGYCERNGDPVI